SRFIDGGGITTASLNLSRIGVTVPLPPLGVILVNIDVGAAGFQHVAAASALSAVLNAMGGVSPGNCVVIPGQILSIGVTPDGQLQTALNVVDGVDAGPWIRILGSNRQVQIKAIQTGAYVDILGQSIPGLLDQAFLEPGEYTIDNGDGGSTIPP